MSAARRVDTPSGRPASGRYERKFLVRELHLREVESLVALHPALFRTAFPPRFVNNVYFDLPGFDNFSANLDGTEHRIKLRIRWYGDAYGHIERPVLERKSKYGLLGTKEVVPLPSLELVPGFSARELEVWLGSVDLPDWLRVEVQAQEAVLLNRYRRSYYLSADGRFRLTIDSELAFQQTGRLTSPQLARELDRDTVVVELKYDPELDIEAARISSVFAFRLTKSSKYAAGIQRFLV